MGSKLSIASIDKQHAREFAGKKRVTLRSGDYIDLQTKFKTTSIQKLILDFQEIIEQTKKRDDISWDQVQHSTFIFYMLALKHFSNLTAIPNDVEKMIAVCEKLIDLGILEEIFDAFDPAELKKIQEMIDRVSQGGDA